MTSVANLGFLLPLLFSVCIMLRGSLAQYNAVNIPLQQRGGAIVQQGSLPAYVQMVSETKISRDPYGNVYQSTIVRHYGPGLSNPMYIADVNQQLASSGLSNPMYIPGANPGLSNPINVPGTNPVSNPRYANR